MAEGYQGFVSGYLDTPLLRKFDWGPLPSASKNSADPKDVQEYSTRRSSSIAWLSMFFNICHPNPPLPRSQNPSCLSQQQCCSGSEDDSLDSRCHDRLFFGASPNITISSWGGADFKLSTSNCGNAHGNLSPTYYYAPNPNTMVQHNLNIGIILQ